MREPYFDDVTKRKIMSVIEMHRNINDCILSYDHFTKSKNKQHSIV